MSLIEELNSILVGKTTVVEEGNIEEASLSKDAIVNYYHEALDAFITAVANEFQKQSGLSKSNFEDVTIAQGAAKLVGYDKSDLEFELYVHVYYVGSYDVKVVAEFNHVRRGREKFDENMKDGELTVKSLVNKLLSFTGLGKE